MCAEPDLSDPPKEAESYHTVGKLTGVGLETIENIRRVIERGVRCEIEWGVRCEIEQDGARSEVNFGTQ